jgi:hypothetical protein
MQLFSITNLKNSFTRTVLYVNLIKAFFISSISAETIPSISDRSINTGNESFLQNRQNQLFSYLSNEIEIRKQCKIEDETHYNTNVLLIFIRFNTWWLFM